jgi:hypothetical protein
VKTFFSLLFAILVAAVIIWFVMSARNAGVAHIHQREQMRQIEIDRANAEAEAEWSDMRRANPQFDPTMEKYKARLFQIKEASEAGKPIPPSRFKTSR